MIDTIDWEAATRMGLRLIPPGPRIPAADRAAVVAQLRQAAEQAIELVAVTSQLPGADLATSGQTLVVDRPGVVRANAHMMATVMGELAQGESPSIFDRVAGRWTGRGIGTVLAFLATHVLGQYEPFSSRLLLCAPTVELVRQQIGADQHDFALWVCLHEQTHRLQFAAAPWLRDYLLKLMRRVMEMAEELPVSPAVVRPSAESRDLGLIGALSAPGLEPVLADVQAVMSLLEGYADMLMDMAGASVIPSLPRIRQAIDQRRRPGSFNLQSWLGRLFGMTSKINQYFEGKTFCEAVRAQVGLDGLNLAYSSADLLPTADELRQPDLWVARCCDGHVAT